MSSRGARSVLAAAAAARGLLSRNTACTQQLQGRSFFGGASAVAAEPEHTDVAVIGAGLVGAAFVAALRRVP